MRYSVVKNDGDFDDAMSACGFLVHNAWYQIKQPYYLLLHLDGLCKCISSVQISTWSLTFTSTMLQTCPSSLVNMYSSCTREET